MSVQDGRARRAAATKKVKYTDGDSDFDSGNGSDDAEVRAVRTMMMMMPL